MVRPEHAPRGASTVLISEGKVIGVRDGLLNISDVPNADAATKVVDLREYFVLPGLIDSHVHLDSDTAGVEAQLDAASKSTAAVAYDAGVNARKTLAAGFTTVRNLGDADGVTLALRDAIAAGKTQGPRILDAGQPFRSPVAIWTGVWAIAKIYSTQSAMAVICAIAWSPVVVQCVNKSAAVWM